MSGTFEAHVAPDERRIAEVAERNPRSPFEGVEYAAVRAALGETPCLFGLRSDGRLVAGCLAFLRGGAFSRRVEIKTVPRLPQDEPFWSGVRRFCRRHRVWELSVQSFAAEAVPVPKLPRELRRRERCEYLLDLSAADVPGALSTNHRRAVKRAERAGLGLRRSREASAADVHLALIGASLARRRERGEAVAAPRGGALVRELVRSGLGELFQSLEGATVLASVLVLRRSGVAYYQSAGTSPDGMGKGASPWLVREIAARLRADGDRIFNLGGAGPDNPGLQRFKSGFGASEVRLEAASFSTAPALARALRDAARGVRRALSGRPRRAGISAGDGGRPSTGSSTPHEATPTASR